MFRSVVLSLCFALYASMALANPPGYNTAFYAAKERGVPLIIFVGCDGRDLPGAEELECRRFPGTIGPVIIVGDPDTLRCQRLSPSATDAEILAAFPKKAASALPAGKYVTSSGVVYREYYSAPQASAPAYASPTTYGGYSSAPIYYSGGFASGVGGSYFAGVSFGSGNCAGGTCPPR